MISGVVNSYIEKGKTNAEIAKIPAVSEGTVRYDRRKAQSGGESLTSGVTSRPENALNSATARSGSIMKYSCSD